MRQTYNYQSKEYNSKLLFTCCQNIAMPNFFSIYTFSCLSYKFCSSLSSLLVRFKTTFWLKAYKKTQTFNCPDCSLQRQSSARECFYHHSSWLQLFMIFISSTSSLIAIVINFIYEPIYNFSLQGG